MVFVVCVDFENLCYLVVIWFFFDLYWFVVIGSFLLFDIGIIGDIDEVFVKVFYFIDFVLEV